MVLASVLQRLRAAPAAPDKMASIAARPWTAAVQQSAWILLGMPLPAASAAKHSCATTAELKILHWGPFHVEIPSPGVTCKCEVVSDRSRSEEHADAGASGRKDMQFKPSSWSMCGRAPWMPNAEEHTPRVPVDEHGAGDGCFTHGRGEPPCPKAFIWLVKVIVGMAPCDNVRRSGVMINHLTTGPPLTWYLRINLRKYVTYYTGGQCGHKRCPPMRAVAKAKTQPKPSN